MRVYWTTLLFFFFISCREHKPASAQNRDRHIYNQLNPASSVSDKEYHDSISLSLPGKRNLLLIEKQTTDSLRWFVQVNWYNDINGKWIKKAVYKDIELVNEYYQPMFRDMNNDGITDMELSIGTGMRGSNEFFYLFFFNPVSRGLEKAKGVDWIVNPVYDSLSGHIQSMSLHGSGCEVADYRIIRGDSLALYSWTNLWVENGMTYQEKKIYNTTGKVIRTQKDSIRDGGESCYSPW